MARKSKYETYVKSKFNKISELVRNGATDKEIIEFLGIKKTSFYEYLNKYPEFSELMTENRQEKIKELKNTLYKKAMGFQYTEVEKTVENGIVTKEVTKIKTALPSETAILILLKHWDKEEDGTPKWANDPATLELKKQELEIKKEQAENENW